jgi:hypothetical protein
MAESAESMEKKNPALKGVPRHVEGNLDTFDSWMAPVDPLTWQLSKPNRRAILVVEQLLIG